MVRRIWFFMESAKTFSFWLEKSRPFLKEDGTTAVRRLAEPSHSSILLFDLVRNSIMMEKEVYEDS